jgi:hypothetical protein
MHPAFFAICLLHALYFATRSHGHGFGRAESARGGQGRGWRSHSERRFTVIETCGASVCRRRQSRTVEASNDLDARALSRALLRRAPPFRTLPRQSLPRARVSPALLREICVTAPNRCNREAAATSRAGPCRRIPHNPGTFA